MNCFRTITGIAKGRGLLSRREHGLLHAQPTAPDEGARVRVRVSDQPGSEAAAAYSR